MDQVGSARSAQLRLIGCVRLGNVSGGKKHSLRHTAKYARTHTISGYLPDPGDAIAAISLGVILAGAVIRVQFVVDNKLRDFPEHPVDDAADDRSIVPTPSEVAVETTPTDGRVERTKRADALTCRLLDKRDLVDRLLVEHIRHGFLSRRARDTGLRQRLRHATARVAACRHTTSGDLACVGRIVEQPRILETPDRRVGVRRESAGAYESLSQVAGRTPTRGQHPERAVVHRELVDASREYGRVLLVEQAADAKCESVNEIEGDAADGVSVDRKLPPARTATGRDQLGDHAREYRRLNRRAR